MIRLLLSFEIGKTAKYFKSKPLAKLITTFLFILVFVFIGVGIYHFFVSGFRYINAEDVVEIRSALTLFLYEIFLLLIAGIVIFSSTISGIFNLFRNDYNNWIISTPGYTLLPKLVMIRSLFSSAWPLLVMFLPMVLALNKVYHLGFLSIATILLSVFIFLISLNAITLSLVVIICQTYYLVSRKISMVKFHFGGLVGILLFFFTIVLAILWKIVSSIDLVKLFKAEEIEGTLSIFTIGDYFRYLPTHPLAMEISNWQSGQFESAILNFATIVVTAVVLVFIWIYVSKLSYKLWQKLQEGTFGGEIKNTSISVVKKAYTFSGGKIMAVFKKEALISSRDYKGILWFMFLFFIWLLQIGANLMLGNNIQRQQVDMTTKVAIIQALQFIIAIYFISSFTLRFVFPSFSIEKRTAWILASAPLSLKRIFFGKYLFYTSFFVVLGLIMSSISIMILNLVFSYAFYTILIFISTIIFIVTLGLSLGAVFPSTETDNPEIISTSLPGLFFTATALIYGAISTKILYSTLLSGNATLLILFVLFTLSSIALILRKIPVLISTKIFY
ncbi:hypothetical protein K9M47_02145 [Candidatus Gracilibacteria bacterium]|nr:hypothetical protein [Candidatus Gracilibacteria bacterium]MCF7898750.1 hypothetical protein [Candidatus Paceibacterota bacterium]